MLFGCRIVSTPKDSNESISWPPEKEDVADIFKFYLKGATEQGIDHNKLADEVITKAEKSGKAFSAGLIELISTESVRLANEAKQKLTENDLIKTIQKFEPDISKVAMAILCLCPPDNVESRSLSRLYLPQKILKSK